MARAHEVAIAADTQPFERGIRDGVIDPLDDAARSLDQLADVADDAGRESSRALALVGDEADDTRRALDKVGDAADDTRRDLDQVGDAARDTGRDGARGIDKLEDALKDAQRQSERTEKAVEDIDTNGSAGFGRLGDAASEVTQEIGANLGEAVSSVRGNLSDLGQVGQDTLGGLSATLAGTGPAGIAGAAALAAGAVGLGLITAELEKQEEQAQRLKEYLSNAWQAAIEGGQEYISFADMIAEMNDLMFNPERAAENNQLIEDANTLHMDANVLRRAAAGEQTALNEVMLQANRNLDDQAGKSILANAEANDLNKRWKERSDIFRDYQSKAGDAERATYDLAMSVGVATGETDDLGNAIYRLPDNTEVVVDAKTKKANADVDAFENNVQGVKDKTVNVTARGRADMSGADAGLNRWISRNNGRAFTIRGRLVTPPGVSSWP